MRLCAPAIWMFVSILATSMLAPRSGRANPVVVDFCLLNTEGASSHVLPRGSADVTMAAERVVLVPYWDRRTKRAQVLVHAWYDLVSDRAQRDVRVGFPEVKGAYRYFMGRENDSGSGILKLRQPTIWRFRAALAGRRLKVAEHPGVARYRRWFTFGVNLPARRKVRLDLLYVSAIGRRLRVDYTSGMGMPDSPRTLRQSAEYWIDYVLHTGGKWKRPIRQGEVVLFAGGGLHVLKRLSNLRPTRKDDLTVRFALGRLEMPVEKSANTDAMMMVQDWEKQERLDTLPLVQQSSVLTGSRAEGLGALAVDGDKATGWISAARKARGAWLQLPADPSRALRVIHLTGLTRAGVARPKQVELRCLRRRRGKIRSRRLTLATLPAEVGPHRIRIGNARGCAAVRLVVRSVHGHGARSVGIAEVAQRYATKPPKGAPKGVKVSSCCFPAKGEPRRALSLAHKALAKLPKARAGWGWEIARLSDVRWSADGTLVHYRLWLENEHRDPRALLLGYLVEVATGRILRRYRMDRAGKVGKAGDAAWRSAMSFVAAHRFLARHGFVAARTQRRDPAARGKGHRLALRGTLPALSGRLRVRSRSRGFAWRFEPNLASRVQARSTGTLRLGAFSPQAPGKETSLATSRPQLDHAFARRHHRVRQRRRKLVDKSTREHQQIFGDQDSGKKRPNTGPVFYRLFPQVHAFGGDVVLHWHPQGRAVLAAWTDIRELTALLPDKLLDRLTFDGSTQGRWERLDYSRHRTWATVHALAPTRRTTLLRSGPLASLSPRAGQPTAPGSARARTAAPGAQAGPPRVTRPRTGCGCGTGNTGRPVLPVTLLILLIGALGRRLRTR